MRRRRLLLGAGVLALVMTALGAFLWFATPTPGVTRDNFRRLKLGMTEPEAERLLGGPGEVNPVPFSYVGTRELEWTGNGVTIRLRFRQYCRIFDLERPDGQMALYQGLLMRPDSDEWEPVEASHDDLLTRLRDWLGW
jgi:hypothetical protein